MGPAGDLGRRRGLSVRRAGVRLFRDRPADSEKLLAYQPPLPTNVRGYDGKPVQTFARERRVELAYDEYPPLVINAFISAEDKTFFSHGGIDYPGLIGAVVRLYDQNRSPADAPRAARPSPSRSPKIFFRTSSMRSAARSARRSSLPPRGSTLTKQQILELYLNSDLPRPERLWRAGRRRAYFDKDVDRPDAAGSRLSRGPAQGADQLRSGPRDRPRAARRNYVLREMARNGYITAPAARAPRRPRSARSATAATRSSASRAAISWRRSAAT